MITQLIKGVTTSLDKFNLGAYGYEYHLNFLFKKKYITSIIINRDKDFGRILTINEILDYYPAKVEATNTLCGMIIKDLNL